MNGKGDTPRPVKWAVYTANWDAIFGKKPPRDSKSEKPLKSSKTEQPKAAKQNKRNKTK